MSTATIFESYHTPLGPSEAFHLSPLRSCGIGHIPTTPKRAVTSQFTLEDTLHWGSRRQATLFTRSVSASNSSFPSIKTKTTSVDRRDGAMGWRNIRAIKGDPSPTKWSGAYSRGKSYTPKQVACGDFYRRKARLSWSQEYGRTIESSGYTSPTSPPSKPANPPPRVVELEGSPPAASTARFEPFPMSLKQADGVMVIKRKPVGSGVGSRTPTSTPASPMRPSDPLFIWTYDRPENVDIARQLQSPITTKVRTFVKDNDAQDNETRKQPRRERSFYRAQEVAENALHPNELFPLDPSALKSPTSVNIRNLRAQQPRQTVRFKRDSIASSILTHSDPTLSVDTLLTIAWDFFCTIWSFLDTHILSANNTYDCLLYILKLALLLYLAACVWNILAGIRDGIVRAVEPVIMVWRGLQWVVTAGW